MQFGDKPPDVHYANMRAWMWAEVKDWLTRGSIDADARLEMDLTGPGYHHDKQDRVVLKSKEDVKERGLDSPDDADALALTFAQRVAPLAADNPLGLFGRLSSGGFGGPGAWLR